MTDFVVVIMAGGAGTRFWPLSTDDRPKQFLALTGERTLLQMSFDRVVDLVGPERILVLTSDRYTELVAQQLPELNPDNIVGEPCRRDTAAAVALAGLLVKHRFGDVPMAVLTADHVVGPLPEFQLALTEAVNNCQGDVLYTLGIKPTYPATQFGYLEMDRELPGKGELQHFRLASFKEKPKLEKAREFIESGHYYWNSGMFVWQTSTILAQFQEHLPQHLEILEPVMDDVRGDSFSEAFGRLQPISVDFAILEKARTVQAIIPRIEWDDVGGWLAVAKYLESDPLENQLHGKASLLESSSNTVFLESEEEEVILLGVSDLVVVRSEGRTLVAKKDSLDQLKDAVKSLSEN